MAKDENAQLVSPAEITEWEIKQARRLIDLSQVNPLPSLLDEVELMSCLYYPLRQVPLPQFQFEMLLWDTDKLNVFDTKGDAEISQVRVTRGTLVNPNVLYKRADDFTVLALVYSLESQMAAVFTNEISQTTWEIVGIFSTQKLQQLVSSNECHLYNYSKFEEAYARAKIIDSNDKVEGGEDASYWSRYDKELDADVPEQNSGQKTEAEYWEMYDTISDEEDEAKANVKAQQASIAPDQSDIATNMILDLVPLFKDCGLENMETIGALIRSVAVPEDRALSGLLLTHQIAWRHTKRVANLIERHYGQAACEKAIHQAITIIKEL